MDIKIFNFKHVGLKILLFIVLVVKKSSSTPGPEKEVVSIYNDNFTTPASRPQYFIEVYRCVKLDVSDCGGDSRFYPLPSATAKIEIVVPDITNSRDSKSNKFYEYVLYNHISCECGTMDNDEEWKLYRSINSSEVSETDFKKNYTKNPLNLIRMSNACAKAQPRYKLHPKNHVNAVPQDKYLAYQQCLPVCVAEGKKFFNKSTFIVSNGGEVVKVLITNDTSCQAYDGVKTQQPKSLSQKAQVVNSSDQESNYEILVYISSAKVILAAFLLSLILFTILIMDITLCRRKKGLLYALVCRRKDDADLFCQNCNERKRNELSV